MLIRSIVFMVVVGWLWGCIQNQSRDQYFDFLKVSDNTYIGISEVIDSLEVPWDLQYSEVTNSIFFTEIKGQVSEFDLDTRERRIIYTVPDVYQKRTSGLLALAVHPDFREKPYLYMCYTLKEDEKIYTDLLRLRYEGGQVASSEVLLRIDGGTAHNGSRMVFGADGMLYWATGDIYSETHAQDSTTLNGKILRMTEEGKVPEDNPIAGSYVYAWGFRNIQGLTVTPKGHIIASEHGDAIEDELNWIRPLHNYGWKKIEGYHDLTEEQEYARMHGTTEPIKSWTPVIAPAAVHYPLFNRIPEWGNSLFLVALKDQTLRVLQLNGTHDGVVGEKIYLRDRYGRLRAVTSDRQGNIYIATSNRDWNPQRGFPGEGDDRILKLTKVNFVPDHYTEEERPVAEVTGNGRSLYQSYCASCHKDDGMGVPGAFPPLEGERVTDKEKLLDILLYGQEMSGKYDGAMPSFGFLSDEEIAEIATYVHRSFGKVQDLVGVEAVRLRR